MKECDGKMKRDRWEIEEDYRSIERAIQVMKDPERLADVQELIKTRKDTEDAVNAASDGDLQKALGFMA